MEPMLSPIPNLDLAFATSDIYYSQYGGLFKEDLVSLIKDLETLIDSDRLAGGYKNDVLRPFINFLLKNLDYDKFKYIFQSHIEDLDANQKSLYECLPILAEALLQRNYDNKYYRSAFDDLQAFQAIVNTIHKISLDNGAVTTLPPLVVWNKKRSGPHTLTSDRVNKCFGISVGVVCLPQEYRTSGLFAWAVLGHEVAGHNFLQSKPGLISELAGAILQQLADLLRGEEIDNVLAEFLSKYWGMEKRVEELASDILGLLVSGPTLAIGAIGYFRGAARGEFMQATGPYEAQKSVRILELQGKKGPALRIEKLSKKVNISEAMGTFGENAEKGKIQFQYANLPSNPHPIPVLRPFAMTEVIKYLNIANGNSWISLIEKEILDNDLKNVQSIKITKMSDSATFKSEEIDIPIEIAITSAKKVASILTNTKLRAAGDKCLSDIFSWKDQDEVLVQEVLDAAFQEHETSLPRGISACHIVGAAIIKAAQKNSDIERIFLKMKEKLITIAENPY